MKQPISAKEITEKVSQALESARKETVPSERLLPFTEAQLRFLHEVISRALVNILRGESPER